MLMKSELRGENEMGQIFPCIQKLKLKPLTAEPGQYICLEVTGLDLHTCTTIILADLVLQMTLST